MEARGLYREMLTQAWRRGAKLPDDHETIRRAIAATEDEWQRSWPRVAPFWRSVDGWLVNDTQLEIYRECLERAEVNAARAVKAANARWKKA